MAILAHPERSGVHIEDFLQKNITLQFSTRMWTVILYGQLFYMLMISVESPDPFQFHIDKFPD